MRLPVGCLVLFAALPGVALAVNKCTLPSGQVVYQDQACAGGAVAKPMDPLPAVLSTRPARPASADLLPVLLDTGAVALPLDLDEGATVTAVARLLGPVLGRLRDPASATFGRLCLVRGRVFEEEFLFLSGSYNARNAYGGYVGARRFTALAGTGILRGSDDPLEVFVDHAGRRYLPQADYWVCAQPVPDALASQAADRAREAAVGH